MKVKMMIPILLFALMVFAQKGVPVKGNNLVANSGKVSIITEIQKLNKLEKQIIEIENGLKLSKNNIVILEKQVADHKKKTKETTAKIAKLKSSRKELEKQIKALEASMNTGSNKNTLKNGE
ncbi:MAG: hypothetical protein GQ534_01785 [Candidatus Delongbacteria bacterium]|nr:hypothetical protein [Candidatus Delongbacteria bacterium]